MVLVAGPNGAGKTTLLRLLAGLLPLSAGTAVVLGHDLAADRHTVRTELALVGHAPGAYDDLTVRENVRFWVRAGGGRVVRRRRRPGAARPRPAGRRGLRAALGRAAAPDGPGRGAGPPAPAPPARRTPRRPRRHRPRPARRPAAQQRPGGPDGAPRLPRTRPGPGPRRPGSDDRRRLDTIRQMHGHTGRELSPISFLRRSASVFPDRTAVVHGDRRYTYRELEDRVDRLVRALKAAGLEPGDRVAFLSPNTPPMLEAHYGVPAAGGRAGGHQHPAQLGRGRLHPRALRRPVPLRRRRAAAGGRAARPECGHGRPHRRHRRPRRSLRGPARGRRRPARPPIRSPRRGSTTKRPRSRSTTRRAPPAGRRA